MRACHPSPLGSILIEAIGGGLTALRFSNVAESCGGGDLLPTHDREVIVITMRWLDEYFSGGMPTFTPSLSLRGTPFQMAVWHEVGRIPYGHTATYGDIAQHIGCRSAQAVGQAVGRNPIALIVPCHRVVGHGGALTGYAYGLDRKQALLRLEQDAIVP